ncbi:MAG TPA: hypothetical protein VFY73_25445 [Ideonella sp.]|uniref:hypothetical protein n=1 Tax=Ideonella sp. TaxID=1929293 RepID=UPI002E337525|nr:hypothetical protein [Ideonella sp.]HEX5687375.1 hypothetical protein [Ideonella sp.]
MSNAKPKGSAKVQGAPAEGGRPKYVAGIQDAPDKERAKALARLAVDPAAGAGCLVHQQTHKLLGDQSVAALMGVVREGIKEVQGGDLSRCEAMLVAQADALQAIFFRTAFRADRQETVSNWEIYMRMAMKVQSQCRMTLETLANIKNPPVVFARQANFASGPQQVNNGVAPAPAPAAISEPRPNELLEADHGERLVTGAASQASRTHSKVETMGAVNRPRNYGRQGKVCKER